MSLLPSFLAQPFERYLTPSERTHIILAAMEVMTETTVFDKMVAGHILEVARRDPGFWLTDVIGLWLIALPFSPIRQCSSVHPFLPKTQVSQAPEATLRQLRGMERAAEDIAAL